MGDETVTEGARENNHQVACKRTKLRGKIPPSLVGRQLMNAILQPVMHSVADLIERLAVPPERIRLEPRPGFATADDAIQNKLCELIDGTLVEKAMGYYESRLASVLIGAIDRYLSQNDLGI